MDEELRQGDDREVLEAVADVLSHDLANLLVIAQSSLELARRQHDDEHMERTATVLNNTEQLVDDVVTLARTGEHGTEIEPTDLSAVAERAWQSVHHTNASLRVTETATIQADSGWLRLLLENLFQNAVEHGSTGGQQRSEESSADGAADLTVEVGLLSRAGESGFYVADDGAGFSLDDPNGAFQPGVSTDENHSGLGLAIVRRIAAAHEWTITAAESRTGGARVEVAGVDLSQ